MASALPLGVISHPEGVREERSRPPPRPSWKWNLFSKNVRSVTIATPSSFQIEDGEEVVVASSLRVGVAMATPSSSWKVGISSRGVEQCDNSHPILLPEGRMEGGGHGNLVEDRPPHLPPTEKETIMALHCPLLPRGSLLEKRKSVVIATPSYFPREG